MDLNDLSAADKGETLAQTSPFQPLVGTLCRAFQSLQQQKHIRHAAQPQYTKSCFFVFHVLRQMQFVRKLYTTGPQSSNMKVPAFSESLQREAKDSERRLHESYG